MQTKDNNVFAIIFIKRVILHLLDVTFNFIGVMNGGQHGKLYPKEAGKSTKGKTNSDLKYNEGLNHFIDNGYDHYLFSGRYVNLHT